MLAFEHAVYGKCYIPYYNPQVAFSAGGGGIPEIYNALGEKMEIFFLRDASSAHNPYLNTNKKIKNRYILWDRFNFGLDTHFYTDACIVETMHNGSKNQRNYALLQEPKGIIKDPYEALYQNRGLAKEFEKILTHDAILLDTFPNAQLYNACAVAYCYMENDDPLRWSEDKFQYKTKDVSMIVSGKQFTQLHAIRNALAQKLSGYPNVDIFGNFVGYYIPHKSLALDTYRYHIAMENEQNTYYFTEKIIDCFISMTLPIYIGARKIGDFFNKDGIIELNVEDLNHIDVILAHCTKEEYESRLEAIKDNYFRSLKYLNANNRLYEELFLTS